MDHASVHLAARNGDIANGKGVHEESGQRFLLGHVHLVVGGGVKNDLGIDLGQVLLDELTIGDVELGAIGTDHFVAPASQFPCQFDAQLPYISEYDSLFGH
jgi:hypothetical protein